MPVETESSHMVLPDGRRLAYGQWGDPKGPAVLLMHGWPGSRLFGRQLEQAAAHAGVRLIVPDRPGIGGSDPQPGRTLLDWARDTRALADALGLRDFAVVGFSGGAPFALACAHLLAERLRGVAVVSGMGPLTAPGSLSALPPHLKVIFSLVRRVPALAVFPARFASLGVRRFPDMLVTQTRLAAGPADRRILEKRSVAEALRAEHAEAFRQGAEDLAWETALFAREWGFALEALPPGILLYHGDEDRLVPVELAWQMARRLPSCRLQVLPGAGHFWILEHFGQVLKDLVAGIPQPARKRTRGRRPRR